MSKTFKWPLCADVFTFWDKLKISKFLFTEKIWTYGKWVEKYEKMWEDYLGGKSHAILVSSGSAANELIALRRKWELQQSGDWPKKNKVVTNVNTWISTASPFIHSGYEVVFCDVGKKCLSITSEYLKKILDQDVNKEIGAVFYVPILGFLGDVEKCRELTEKHGAKFLMDNCEASCTSFFDWKSYSDTHVLNYTTCSTSIFYSHFSTSGTEGGLIFTQSEEERDWFKMMRSHGLTRGMSEKYKNKKVNGMFDFALLGSNFRSSNLQAYMASLDLDRAMKFSHTKRNKLFRVLNILLDNNKFYSIGSLGAATNSPPLAIPILCKDKETKIKVETYCKIKGIETRPVIAGCLCEHTAFKGLCDSNDFPNAMEIHEKGLYIGLNKNVTEKMVTALALELNKL